MFNNIYMEQNIINIFRDFIQSDIDIEAGEKILIKHRNNIIKKYSLSVSRNIWMSLLLYKFKNDMNTSDVLWNDCKRLIIGILLKDDNLDTIIDNYIKTFNEWKMDDIVDIVYNVSNTYYELLNIKKSIEESNDINTINTWSPHYEKLIKKIHEHCTKINILDKVEETLKIFEQKKHNIMKDIFERAYWDKIKEDVQNKKYDSVLAIICEIKIYMEDIIPKQFNKTLYEVLDIEFISTQINNNVFDMQCLKNIYLWILQTLQKWDCAKYVQYYDDEITNIQSFDDIEFHDVLINVLKKSIVKTIDLKTRKNIFMSNTGPMYNKSGSN